MPFFDTNGNFELLVRFRGVADGHILLSTYPNGTEPLYMVRFPKDMHSEFVLN